MRSSLLLAISSIIAACAGMAPTTPPVPITPHVVSAADYPSESVKLLEEGATTLQYLVLRQGTVGDVQILKSSGFARLDEASVDMVKSKWRFRPAMSDGRPVRYTETAKISFVLNPSPSSYLHVFVAPETSAAEIALSPEARMLIAPIHVAYQQIEYRQSLLPPPKNDTERLVRLGELDQAVRSAILQTIDLSGLTPEQHATAFRAEWDEINRYDLANQTALKAMLPPEGWFLKSRYGQAAGQAAFDIVVHAVNDKDLQHAVLARIEPLVTKGEISALAYGMLYDRVAAEDGRLQRYGSEILCKDHKWMLAPLENPEQVNVWRKTMGFALTAEENVARFANYPPCG